MELETALRFPRSFILRAFRYDHSSLNIPFVDFPDPRIDEVSGNCPPSSLFAWEFLAECLDKWLSSGNGERPAVFVNLPLRQRVPIFNKFGREIDAIPAEEEYINSEPLGPAYPDELVNVEELPASPSPQPAPSPPHSPSPPPPVDNLPNVDDEAMVDDVVVYDEEPRDELEDIAPPPFPGRNPSQLIRRWGWVLPLPNPGVLPRQIVNTLVVEVPSFQCLLPLPHKPMSFPLRQISLVLVLRFDFSASPITVLGLCTVWSLPEDAHKSAAAKARSACDACSQAKQGCPAWKALLNACSAPAALRDFGDFRFEFWEHAGDNMYFPLEVDFRLWDLHLLLLLCLCREASRKLNVEKNSLGGKKPSVEKNPPVVVIVAHLLLLVQVVLRPGLVGTRIGLELLRESGLCRNHALLPVPPIAPGVRPAQAKASLSR
ncbi:hypothetical protein C8F01DRAFT_1256315 [Mycena amicta]|nr:hypothetical protein C8F01DRAFT_1256315 [Mycena amicta]